MLRLAAVALAARGLIAQAQPPRICYGDDRHPATAGTVWLVANAWGYHPGALLGQIDRGTLRLREVASNFPARDPEWRGNYRILLGVLAAPLAGTPPAETDTGYEPPGYWQYAAWYVTDPLEKVQVWPDPLPALASLGVLRSGKLVLAPPARREIVLLYPGGRPASGIGARVLLFGSRENHCGLAAGMPLGNYTADATGRIVLRTTASPLAVGVPYWLERTGGPAGTAYEALDDIVTGRRPVERLVERWKLPVRDYEVRVTDAAGKGIAGVGLSGCLWGFPCGAGCGNLGGATDAAGVLRFREPDLRRLGKVTAARGGHERPFGNGELKQLIETRRVTILWR